MRMGIYAYTDKSVCYKTTRTMTREEFRDKYQDNICETCKQMHRFYMVCEGVYCEEAENTVAEEHDIELID